MQLFGEWCIGDWTEQGDQLAGHCCGCQGDLGGLDHSNRVEDGESLGIL